ncbi:MAG: PD40 domain-containing protein [Ignavibacteriales bacterium]|nr:PD40 domain-containing protein [Ignavibacteriales bacterium]
MKRFPAFFIVFLAPVVLSAQEYEFPHSELEWYTLETEHFFVHYHDGTQRTAQEVARIAEGIFKPITEMYQHIPDQKVSIVIRDHDDYSNGAAYFYDNKIEIWSSALDFELRGTHPWLLNVVTHEFTHIVQIQTAMKMGRRLPGVYFQWLGYEAERRPDVLYGFPNVIVSYPLSGFVVPSWFAEGVAQYNHPDLNHDYWDSHRDMILRMYMLEGNPLSWEEMAVFGKTSLGNESSYNAGFSITEFIAKKYGTDKLREISEALGAPLRLTIDGAIKQALGKSGEELYQEWRDEKEKAYRSVADSVGKQADSADIIEPEGFGNFYPQFSGDGSKLAYVSNKGGDYFSQSSVYVYDTKTKEARRIVGNVRSTLSFSPDGRFLSYSKATRDNPHWSKVYDIYKYDLVNEEETRLTYGWRALNPKLSADGSELVFVVGKDGTLNIAVANADGKDFMEVTRFNNGEQVFTPVFSPDGKTIAFGFSNGHRQKVAIINEDGSDFKVLASTGDCRNPYFSPDGRSLYYSSDMSGIFNIYRLDLSSNESNQVTNVLGGAFLPTVDRQGNLAFANYAHTGFNIAMTKIGENSSIAGPIHASFSAQPAGSQTQQSFSHSEGGSPPANQDMSAGQASRPYKNVFSSLSLIPFVRFDNYNPRNSGIDNVKPGMYFTSFDMLDKMSLFGGGAINRNLERDLFLIFEYRDRLPLLHQLGLEPTLSLEVYNITRKIDFDFNLFIDVDRQFSTAVTFNLFELDVSLRQKIFSENNDLMLTYRLDRYSQDFGSWLHPRFGVIPSSRSVYLIGNSLSLNYRHDGIMPTKEREINPVGRSLLFKYSYELNRFNPTDSTEDRNGFRVPIYSDYNLHRIELNWSEHFEAPAPGHTLTLSLHGGSILGPAVDDFFDFYVGGFAGMRGYPFYALGGNEYARASATYRLPVSTELDFRILQFYFKKLYASVFADVGNAWSGSVSSAGRWKRDVGLELRLESFSFYAYPTRFFLAGAYGLDQFSRTFNSNNVNPVDVTYGKEWRFYLGVLFGFEISEFKIVPRLLL